MKILFILFLLLSCSMHKRKAAGPDYHVLIFSFTSGNNKPKILKNCEPYELKEGSMVIKKAVANFANDGMYCQQTNHHTSYECTSTYKLVKAVLVQGKMECKDIPYNTAFRRKSLI